MSTTFQRLATLLARDYKLAPDRLTREAPLEGLGIDSLGTVELLWNIEDEFKIKLPVEPVELLTLGDVVRFVDELIAAQASAVVKAAPIGPAAQPSP